MRKDSDGPGPPPMGKRHKDGSECRLSLLIHHKAAGAIIGKGGENIKRLRHTYEDVDFNIPDSNSPERVLNVIGSSPDSVLRCLRDIVTKLDEVYQEKMGGENSELRVLVHASHAGAVIGKSGFKIKELREECKTDIKVFSERAPYSTDRCVRINGEASDVVRAVHKILAIVQQECQTDIKVFSERAPYSTDRCVRINGETSDVVRAVHKILAIVQQSPMKGPDQPYDSANYDPAAVDLYGGYPPDHPSWGPPAGGPRGGRSPGYGGHGGRMQQQQQPPPFANGEEAGPRPPRGAHPMHHHHQQQQHQHHPGMGGRGGGAPPPAMLGPGGGTSTTQVTIPDELAGVVIGKGGQRIAETRVRSGADISIDTAANEQNERVITITGTPNAIQMAQYLLQQTVRSSSVGRQYIQDQQLGGS